MSKYHFLKGKGTTPETKDFKSDEDAISAAKEDGKVLRVQHEGNLKYVYENLEAIAKATAAMIVVLAFLCMSTSLHAATVIGVIGTPGAPGIPLNSLSGTTNSSAFATNGVYSLGLAASTIETNLINIVSESTDHDVIIQLSATGATAASTNGNVVFVITSTVLPVAITNNPANGANYGSTPRAQFATYNLPLNATANGTFTVTTNIVLSVYSTPPFANGYNLFVESVQNTSSTGALTNYSVAVIQ